MRIVFDEQVPVPPEVVFEYMRSPTEWPRLYGAFGEVTDLGGGWYRIPLAGGPPHLEARPTALVENQHAAWDLRGTFAGKGKVNLEPVEGGTRVTGFEEVEVAGVSDPEHLAVIASGFEAIWQTGWERLRGMTPSGEPQTASGHST